MIYILTIHYKTDKWIDVQLRYIKKYISDPYKVYACLEGIKGDFSDKFDFIGNTYDSRTNDLNPYDKIRNSHANKLNYLANKVISQANNEDILIFMDGDAFPININFYDFIKKTIQEHYLVAMERTENQGDKHPHPAFCATTVGFWKRIQGDWSSDYGYEDNKGKVIKEVGGTLMERLNDSNIDWFAMNRTNKKNLHPLFFGVYADMVYHHGAGLQNRF